jgi:hypothetical protein
MAGRPPSTGDPSRPTVNPSLPPRPNTSAGIFDHDNQYTYSQDYSHEEDEESEVEDVFAFLPPSTADQQQPIPSSLIPPTVPELPTPAYFPTVDSPPSTESQSGYMQDGTYSFRMHRVNDSGTTNVTTTLQDSVPSPSSREVPISLPSPSLVSEKDSQMRPKFRLSSNNDSLMTPSMMEEDSREGSTKMEFDFTATKKITLILKFVFAIHSSPDQVLSKTSFGFCGTPAPP